MIKNKEKLNQENVVKFSIELSETIKTKLSIGLGINLSKINDIPMRWVKGDTESHKDFSPSEFENTYLIYLTESIGDLIIDNESYLMNAGSGYIFSKGIEHSTVNTANTERLILEPMSESGFVVGIDPVPIPCFKEDTQILTDQGYKLIQDLRKGDLVKTLLHDFLPIDMIGKREMHHPASQHRIKDQLYKCSKDHFGDEVFEPLILTGCHSILEDKFVSQEQREKVLEVNGDIYITEKKYRIPACADPRASVYEYPGSYTIYHVALENNNYYNNYGIYANGLLVESCSKRYLKELSGMSLIE